jgi:hypothetical protein
MVDKLNCLTGTVSTLVGTGKSGNVDGPINVATFNNPLTLAFNKDDGSLFVADRDGQVLRKVSKDGVNRGLMTSKLH